MIYKGSRYSGVDTYYPLGTTTEIFDIRETKKFDLTKATYHTWMAGDRIDNLSNTYYGDSAYWWAILDANPLYESPLDINAGDLVAIPPFEEVVREL